ncbi:hypothetical protein NYG90_00020 [Helicobacter sp. XJK30-2]|uniref:Uncharacterized protein n=1 Tax=Helicobacter zhangjianzhongii TaxID=2974574 RepID=A0ACC6FP40_9HELI|nr:hypothetical protein [Helicobacter sp. XJK30-2]MDL0081080.1 hypothetical protein [Helicobacter sp. XJK30-2]
MRNPTILNPEAEVEKFKQRREIYKIFEMIIKNYVKNIADNLAKEGKISSNYKITSRTKKPESYKGKITRPNKDYTDPLHQITDLAGVKVIFNTTKDQKAFNTEFVKRIGGLRDDENSANLRDEKYEKRQFGYLGIHHIVWFDESLLDGKITWENREIDGETTLIDEWENGQRLLAAKGVAKEQLKNFRAEIQTMTFLQYIWAEIEHKVRYKPDKKLDKETERIFDRIAALLELSDAAFEELLELVEQKDRQTKDSIQQIHTASEPDKKHEREKQLLLDSSDVIQTCLNSEDFSALLAQVKTQNLAYINAPIDYIDKGFVKLLQKAEISSYYELKRIFDERVLEQLRSYAEKSAAKAMYQKLEIIKALIYLSIQDPKTQEEIYVGKDGVVAGALVKSLPKKPLTKETTHKGVNSKI